MAEPDRYGYGRVWTSAGVPGGLPGVGLSTVAGSQLIPVRVGDTEIQVEAVVVAGTEPTSGKAAKAAGTVLDAFDRAQDTIIQVAKSTAEMINRTGTAIRPDRVDVEFGLPLPSSGMSRHL